MTIPNLITGIRVILVPIFIIYLINGKLMSALVVFTVAAVSDGVDGFIARLFDQKSRLGAFLDPLADKILLVAAFITLAVSDLIPPWLTVTVISRDFFILLGVLILYLHGTDFTIRPSILSKATTCVQLVTVFVVLAKGQFPVLDQRVKYLFWLAGLLTISSGLHYMRNWFGMMGEDSLAAAGDKGEALPAESSEGKERPHQPFH
jgi:cardiolipin synthase (CMP-forming)